MNNDDNAYR